MKKKLILLAFCLVLILGLTPGCGGGEEVIEEVPGEVADKVLTNGQFYTVDENQTVATAVAIKDGKYIFVGDMEDEALAALIGESTEVIDLNGSMAVPGMIDAHTHPEAVALDSWSVVLPWTYDVDELLTFVKEYCEEHPVEECPYFFGKYYPSDLFGEEGPTRELLDQYVSDRPVRLQDFSDHCYWFNSKALELMGISADTPDPVPGLRMFVRDANGEPTGWVFEGAQSEYEGNMYEAIGWYPPEAVGEDLWKTVIDYYHSQGVIGLGDAIAGDDASMEALYNIDQAGALNMYVSAMVLMANYDDLENAIAEARDYQSKYATENIAFDTIKYFLDGTNEIGTSSVLEPFSNDPSGTNYGALDMTMEQLTEVMVRLNEEALDLQIHLVGDGGFRTACDATEAAQEVCGDDWQIDVEFVHCELVDEADMARPAELGIIINWSPHWTGGYFGEMAMEYLGEERYNSMYNFQPMIEAGAVVNMGSDTVSMYEFHRSSPFFGMECAITRVDPEFPMDADKYPGSVRPEASSAFTMDQMIEGYTLNSAIQFRIEDISGTIEVGKNADLCVVGDNLYDMPADQLAEVTPLATLFQGELIYGEL